MKHDVEVGGTRTYFFYSDEGLVAEYDVNGHEIRSYGYEPDSIWTTDPLFLKEGGDYYFYQNDHLGTPQKLVAQNGAVVWSATYSAFGQANVKIETVTNNSRFPRQYVDAETGLHYNYYRYYDSEIGRYLRTDPKGLRGGLNLFAYAFNNPGKNMDPTGLGVHPHQIVPADEAERIVRKTAEWFPQMFVETYNNANSFGRKALLNAPPEQLFLKWLGKYVNAPGGGVGKPPGWPDVYHNRFVFTCKYGWIDMGHFFLTARIGYWLERRWMPDFLDRIPVRGDERLQWLLYQIDKSSPNAQSYNTVEDWWSNRLGTTFGREVARERPTSKTYEYIDDITLGAILYSGVEEQILEGSAIYIAEKWYDFLVKSGAIQYDKDDKVHE